MTCTSRSPGYSAASCSSAGIAFRKSAPWFARATTIASMNRRSPSEAFFESTTALSRCFSFSGGGVTAER